MNDVQSYCIRMSYGNRVGFFSVYNLLEVVWIWIIVFFFVCIFHENRSVSEEIFTLTNAIIGILNIEVNRIKFL